MSYNQVSFESIWRIRSVKMIEILDWTCKDPLNLIGFCAGVCWNAPVDDVEKNIKRAKDCIKSNHGRTEEYPDVYVVMDEYSARVIREFYTHVIGTTRLQSSTRYVDAKEMNPEKDFYIPANFTDNQKDILLKGYQEIMKTYTELESNKVSKEDAANILPLGMHTKIVTKINLRALEHMAHKRCCYRAYKEFRALMKEFKAKLKQVSEEWKWICENMLVSECKALGYCPEVRSCGKEISKEEALKAIKYWKENKNLLTDDGR